MEESYWAVSVVEYKKGKYSGNVGKYLNHAVYVVKAAAELKARKEGEKLYSAECPIRSYADRSTRVKFIGKKIETW